MSPTPQPESRPLPVSPNSSEHADTSHVSGPRKRKRRAQYTLKACDRCRNRKVKCCGKLPCQRCVDRSENCTYQLSDRLEAYQIAGSMFTAESQRSQTTIELQKRVGELEREIGRLRVGATSTVEENENTESSRLPFAEEPDTFQLNNCALQSKFQALIDAIPDYTPTASYLSCHLDDEFPEAEPTNSKMLLPEPKTFHRLLDRFFNWMNSYFPLLPRPDFEGRLLDILCKSQYPSVGLEVTLCSHDVPFMALVALVLAQAQQFEQEEPGANHPTKDWKYYYQSRSLIRNQRWKGQELDLIRVHTLCSMYLVQKERVADACQQIMTAIVIAQAYGLNDQSSWPKDLPPTERVARKCLFWATYYQDRRIAEKLGQPYFLRDSEVDVDDFRNERQESADYCSLAYMQNTVEWARLWGEVWDMFFAKRARKTIGHAEAFASMDSRVQHIIQGLPADLKFLPHHVASYHGSGDLRTRYSLLTFMRLNLLRLTLHHNQLVGLPTNTDTLMLILDLSSETIFGVCNYLTVFPNSKSQIGVVAAAALVDSVCHLVPPLLKLLRTGYEEKATSTAVDALRRARGFLSMLAETSRAASRANKILQPVFAIMDNTLSIFNPESLVTENETDLTTFETKLKEAGESSASLPDNWDIGGLEGLGGVFSPDFYQEPWLGFGQEVFDVNAVVI